ncbi:hypothetical protein [Thiothrix unzii]|uniref:Uncharacterized protein n=1 Tax=Thiothrix unzii TaxID=111769 RepID=A0A975IH96_9GAMM|nr:hypothetical protein [Thiothrix unzii]QTR53692.1 hypothetical protein J9260_00960 [Thiothrix unzii]
MELPEWLRYIFEVSFTRDLSEGYTCLNALDLEETDDEIAFLISQSFEYYHSYELSYTDDQIAYGIEKMLTGSYAHSIIHSNNLESKLSLVRSFKKVYQYGFNKRCQQKFHCDCSNKINCICDMLWDISPLPYCSSNQVSLCEQHKVFTALAEVMEFALYLPNPACVKSGLHGLGHLHHRFPKAGLIVDRFLSKSHDLPSVIIDYAREARTGCVL